MGTRHLNQREKEQQIELLPLLDAAQRSDWLEVGAYPLSSIQITTDDQGEAAAGIDYEVWVSNIPQDDQGKKIADVTAAAAGDVITLTPPARYVQVNITGITGGRAGATWHGAVQN